MRRLALFTGLALVLSVGAGCATVAAPGTGSLGASGPQDTARTLRILGGDFPYTDAAVAGFRRRHPDIELEYVTGAVSFENGSVQALLRSGSGPDVLLVNSGPGRVGLLADAGLIAPLDDVFRSGGLEERFAPEVIRQTRSADTGRIFEVVEGLDVFQVYYNRTLLERAGAGVPRDWAGFLATCDRLRQAGIAPMVAGVRDNFAGGWLLGALVQASAGRDLVREAVQGTRRFDAPEVVEGGRSLTELLDRGCLDGRQAAALDGEQSQAAFWRGEAAMTVVPQGSMVDAEQDGVDVSRFGAFPMPPRRSGDPALPTAGLALSWVVNNNTRSLSAVNAWLDWITGPEYLQLTSERGRSLVPALNLPPGVRFGAPITEGLRKVAEGPGYNPSVYLSDTAREAWYQAVQGIVTGRVSPEQAMRAVADEQEAGR